MRHASYSRLFQLVLATTFLLTAFVWAQDIETVLYTFDGTHGGYPTTLIEGADGDFYGVTLFGGNPNCNGGCGVIFKLSRSTGLWIETVIHSFTGGTDGYEPRAIVIDPQGNIFGVASVGGSSGLGVAFKMTPFPVGSWGFKVLHSFPASSSDGVQPVSLVLDKSGNVYGAAGGGGTKGCNGGGCGTIFELSPTKIGPWKETVLHRFAGPPSDGRDPNALAFDGDGNLDGLTPIGGAGCTTSFDPGCGTVFQLSPSGNGWKEKILHSFNASDGSSPYSFLIDPAGNLFGVTFQGGNLSDCGEYGCGVVFQLSRTAGKWTETTVHQMTSTIDGEFLQPIAIDSSGNLYSASSGGGPSDWGTVFELSPGSSGTWNETILFDFPTSTDGEGPNAILVDPSGNIYGTTYNGGNHASSGDGVVFELTPSALSRR